MPSSLIVAVIELGLKELGAVLAVLTGLGLLAGGLGWLYYNFRAQKNRVRDDRTKVKADAAAEWREVAAAHSEKIKDLQGQVSTWKMAHEICEGKINEITQFNLRLQSRERGYQRTINRLEIRTGMEPTDFNDPTDAAPSFDS